MSSAWYSSCRSFHAFHSSISLDACSISSALRCRSLLKPSHCALAASRKSSHDVFGCFSRSCLIFSPTYRSRALLGRGKSCRSPVVSSLDDARLPTSALGLFSSRYSPWRWFGLHTLHPFLAHRHLLHPTIRGAAPSARDALTAEARCVGAPLPLVALSCAVCRRDQVHT